MSVVDIVFPADRVSPVARESVVAECQVALECVGSTFRRLDSEVVDIEYLHLHTVTEECSLVDFPLRAYLLQIG